jgi:hypothetical protein
MPYFSQGAGFSRRPSPLLVLVGSAGVALGLIGLGLATIDNFSPEPGSLAMKAAPKPASALALGQQVASARPGR